VGRALVARALADGHDVTLLHRGLKSRDLFPEATHVLADRDGGLDALGDGGFDACIDVSGYLPRVVRQSTELLADRVGRYVFVSTVSVYSDLSEPSDENGLLATLEDASVEEITGETYGGLKVLCERVVTETYGDRSVLARPTFVVGPHDHTGRFTWWVHRGAQGGRLVVPEAGAWRIQLIDVRDLAGFLLLGAADDTLTGPYNVVGPQVQTGLVDVVEDVASLSGVEVHPVVVEDAFLLERGLTIEQLPLWIPDADWAAWAQTSGERALAAGLVHTPLVETIHATLDHAGVVEGIGLPPDRERELLVDWDAR